MRRRQTKHPDTQFPKPDFHTVQDRTGASGNKRNSLKFFKYWHDVIPEAVPGAVELIQVRVYRHWPVIDVRLAEPERTDTVIFMMEGACPFDPDHYEQWFLEHPQLGSGEYHLCLNENGVHGEVMECFFSAIDLDKFPPIVDLRTVVRGNKKNEDYIRWLGTKGQSIPGESGEEDYMGAPSGAGSAFGVVANALTDVAKTAVDSAKEGAKAQVEAANARADAAIEQSRPDVQFEAHNKSIEMVTDAAKGAIEMVRENQPRQADPIEMVKAVGDIFVQGKNMHGEGGGSGDKGIVEMVVTIMKEKDMAVANLQREQWGFMEKMFQMQQAANTPTTAVAAAPVDPIEATLEKMERWHSMFERLNGRGRHRERDYEPPAPAAPPAKPISVMIFENLPAILTITALAANIFYNMKAKDGAAAQNPNDAIAKMNADVGALGLGGAVAQPGAAPAPAANPAQPAYDPADPRAPWRAFMDQIAEAFILHFFTEGFDGLSFAEHLLSDGLGGPEKESGRRKYESIRANLGEANFKVLARENSDIWSKVGGQPQAFDEFVSEIFNYDQLVKEQRLKDAGPVGVAS